MNTTTPTTLAEVRAAIAAVDALTFPAPATSPLDAVRDAITAHGPYTTRSGATWTPDGREQFASLAVEYNRHDDRTTPSRWTITVWGPMTTKNGDTDKAARVEVFHYDGTNDAGDERTYAYTKADRYKAGRFESMPEGARDSIAEQILSTCRPFLTPEWWSAAATYAADRDRAYDCQRLAGQATTALAELARKIERAS